MRQSARAKELGFVDVEERLLVRIAYRDLLERGHEEYFEVVAVGGGRRIANDVGKSEFDRWARQHTELTDLDPDGLLDLVLRTNSSP